MTHKTKTVLLRFVRGLGALGAGAFATWLVTDDVLSIIPDAYDWIVLGVVAPGALALEKWFRYGSDPGEDPSL